MISLVTSNQQNLSKNSSVFESPAFAIVLISSAKYS